MTDAIKVKVLDDATMAAGSLMTLNRRERARDLARAFQAPWLAEPPFETEVVRTTHEIHEFRMALQSIRVAYDPNTSTLYIGERPERGYVEQAARNAYERGLPNPYLREVVHATTMARMERDERRAHAAVVADAVERLKSRKPGVRRRAKRLLAKLGK